MKGNWLSNFKRSIKMAQGNLYFFGLKEFGYVVALTLVGVALFVFAAPFANHCEQDILGAQTELNTVTVAEAKVAEGDYVAICGLSRKHLDLLRKLETMRASCWSGEDRQGDRYLHWQNQYKSLIDLQENAVHEACR